MIDASSEEDYVSDSCPDSLRSEIIQHLCLKTKNFKVLVYIKYLLKINWKQNYHLQNMNER